MFPGGTSSAAISDVAPVSGAPGGSAMAESDSIGRGSVTASSRVLGQMGRAQSTSRLTSGEAIESALILATSQTESLKEFRSYSKAHLNGQGPDLPVDPATTLGVVSIVTKSEPLVQDSFAEILLGAENTGQTDGLINHHIVIDLVLDIDVKPKNGPLALVMLAGPTLAVGELEAFGLRIELGDAVIVEERFEDRQEATTCFSTTLLSLDKFAKADTSDLRISFDVDSSKLGDGFKTVIQLK